MKKTYSIEGMHCASCAQIISKQIKKIDGVTECEVNFGTKSAVIITDGDIIGLDNLNTSINKFGYNISSNELSTEKPHSDHSKHDSSKIGKEHIIILSIMIVFVFGMMLWDVGMIYKWRNGNEVISSFFHHLMPIFATYVLFGLGMRYVKAAFSYFKTRVGNMDSLIGIGTTIAFIYSFVVTAFENSLSNIMDVSWNFYEGIIVVVGFSLIGKYIEDSQLAKTGEAISALIKLQSKEAIILIDGIEQKVSIDQVKKGDIVIVKPGEQIPVDGKVIDGVTEIDESMITGEPLPIIKNKGDMVIGGTINVNGTISISATSIGATSVLAKIVEMVSQAQNFKPSIQKLADKIAEYFVPIVLILAVLTLAGWMIFGKEIYSDYWIRGIIGFVAILSVACPCALGLATPLAVINSISRATKHGILVKNSEGLLQLKNVDTIVFDKTGTITTGKPTMIIEEKHDAGYLSILYSLEKLSNHPISHAIVTASENTGVIAQPVVDFNTIPGFGLKGVIDNKQYYVGNVLYVEQLLPQADIDVSSITNIGETPVILFTDEKVLDIYGVSDTIKPGIDKTIKKLQELGIKTIMCTGDHHITAQHIGSGLAIDEVVAEASPEDKANLIKKLRENGQKIAMVGDGINDSIALSLADVSIGMSDGSDVSIESSDLILLHGDLNKVLDAFNISKSMNSLIKQNLFWAFSYNIIGIPLAGGWLFPFFGRQLTPVFAGLFMALSSIIVSINSVRGK